MARRNRNVGSALAGLAAIGALGFMAGKGLYKKPGEKLADLDDRNVDTTREYDTAGAEGYMPSAAASGDDVARFADVGTNFNETGQPYSLMATPGPAASTTRAAAPTRAAPTRAAAPSRADEVDAAAMFRAREREERGTPAMRNPNISEEVSRRTGVRLDSRAGAGRGGQGGPTAAELEAYARQQRNARATPRQMTREEMIGQIPTGGYPDVSGGERVSGSEFTRNVGNALAALGPTRLAGFGNAAVEGATARGAAQRASTLRAERTEAARKGQTPTKFTSTRASDSAKRTRKFDEDEAGVEFKRGGKIKKMASGGMTSASKRGDGIASKGKTKCKMY